MARQQEKLVQETGTEFNRIKDVGQYFKVIPPSCV